MARGPSGRIVVEVDPALKRELHSALAAEGLSLKDWFIQRARQFMADRNQPALPGIAYPSHQAGTLLMAAETPPPYRISKEPKS